MNVATIQANLIRKLGFLSQRLAAFCTQPCNNFIGLFVLFIGLAISTFASPNLAAASGPYDPFYNDVFFPEGPFLGEKVNTKKSRSVIQLSDTKLEQHFGKREGYIFVANFYHKGEFYFAYIPELAIQKTSLVLDYFTPQNLLAHVMALYTFKKNKPIELIAKVPNSEEFATGQWGQRIPTIQMHEMLFSLDGTPRIGDRFDIQRGVMGHYLASYRFLSLESWIRDTVHSNRGDIEILDFNMSPAQRNAALKRSLLLARIHGMTTMYHTLNNNCVANSLYSLGIAQAHSSLFTKSVESVPFITKWILLANESPKLTRAYLLDRIKRYELDRKNSQLHSDK